MCKFSDLFTLNKDDHVFKEFDAKANTKNVDKTLSLSDFFTHLLNTVEVGTTKGLNCCKNHVECHTFLYEYFRDNVVYDSSVASTDDDNIMTFIENNFNLPKYPTSIELMNFVTKLLSEIPLKVKDDVGLLGGKTGKLQPFFCISQSQFETRPFVFRNSTSKHNTGYFLDSNNVNNLVGFNSLEEALIKNGGWWKDDIKLDLYKKNGIVNEENINILSTTVNQRYSKRILHIGPKRAKGTKYYPYQCVKYEGVTCKNAVDETKTKDSKYYSFGFPYFEVNNLKPNKSTSFNFSDNIFIDSSDLEVRSTFLFTCDEGNYFKNPVATLGDSDSFKVDFRAREVFCPKDKICFDKNASETKLKSFRGWVKTNIPEFTGYNGTQYPHVVYNVSLDKPTNPTKKIATPLWMDRPSRSIVPRSERVTSENYWLYIPAIPATPEYTSEQFAKLIFGDELTKLQSSPPLFTGYAKTNVPTNIFWNLIKDLPGNSGDYNEPGDWAKELSCIFNGIVYSRKTADKTTKIVKRFKDKNTGCENEGTEGMILVSRPITGLDFKKIINMAVSDEDAVPTAVPTFPTLKNHGNKLGRSHSLRIPDQGTVMGKLKDYMCSNGSSSYKETFKGSKISATQFTLLTLQNDNDEGGSFKKWKDLKEGASFQTPSNGNDGSPPTPAAPAVLPASQEWCHLMGHGDGGGQTMGNLVSGSWFCNSEQLAIEQGQREETHKLTDRYELRTTAYLFPNQTSFFTKSYLSEEPPALSEERPAKKQRNESCLYTLDKRPREEGVTQGKTMPICAAIDYKIYYTKGGTQKNTETKIFHHTFEGQGEFWDINQHKILYTYVKYLLLGREIFYNDLAAVVAAAAAAAAATNPAKRSRDETS